jgi:hypothetical protein
MARRQTIVFVRRAFLDAEMCVHQYAFVLCLDTAVGRYIYVCGSYIVQRGVRGVLRVPYMCKACCK